jgi:hypothetical protein
VLNYVLHCKWQWCCRAIALLSLLPLVSCIASPPGSGSQPITITISPASENYMPVGGTLQFTASVQGSNAGVTWTTQQSTTCNAAGPNGGGLGTITSSGLYTAPPQVPTSPCSVIIVATSNADSTVLQQVQALVQVKIAMNSYPATIPTGGTYQFTATVTGSTNSQAQDLYWQVSPSTEGLISPTGLYTAPPAAASGITITAGSAFDSSSKPPTTTANISITPVTISIVPTSATVVTGAQQKFTATVTGVSNTSVGWLVAGIPNGNSSFGTITTDASTTVATYTAPLTTPGGTTATITITAESQADPSAEVNAIVTVNPAPSISPSNAPIAVGTTQQFTASVSPVTWSVAPATGCSGNIGSINASTGLYTAPPTTVALPVSPCQIQITATPSSGPAETTLANLHVAIAITNVTASPTTIGVGGNWLYTASVSGASAANQGVIWTSSTPNPGACTNPGGQFSSSVPPYTDPNGGFYYAPLCAPSSPMTIIATSAFDGTQSQSTTVTVQPLDPVGSATSTNITCPANIGGTTGASCYQLDVSCPGVADWPNTYLKVNQPTGVPLGTVILGTGSGGNYVYDNDTPDFFYTDSTTGDTVNGGLDVVNGILTAGYTTVQVAFSPLDNPTEFPSGWLTGPGGVRRLACRYATVAQWVYANIQQSTSVPMCATGNSGGAGAIGYALTNYGENNIFAMVETTSGPPMTRLDWGCSSQSMTANFTCNSLPTQTLPFNFSLSEAEIIDPAYPAGEAFCTNAVKGTGTQAPADLFLSDSVLGGVQPTPTVDPPTVVNIVMGGMDPSAGVQQGQHWGPAVGASTRVCVSDAPHALPAAPSGDGVTQIVNDITNLCKLP